MEKEKLLMNLLETVRNVREEHFKRKPEDDKHMEKSLLDKERNFHHKITPLAQNTLYLLLQEGSMNQRSIANRLNVTGQAISELMKKLEERELVSKQSGEFNNENIISLTSKGEKKGQEFQEKTAELAETIFQNFNEEELIMLSNLLNKMQIERRNL